MNQLKMNIFIAIKKFEANQTLPEIVRKQIPMSVLFMETNASLEDMKKAIYELVDEKKILFLSNDLSTRVMKSINHNPPSREAFLEKPTEDESFVCGCIINISE